MCHYNSITNPKKPSVLVGLGLPNYCTRCDLDRRDVHDAVRQSEDMLIEQVQTITYSFEHNNKINYL